MTRTIAIYGGSFDPPHVGHLLVAAHVLATQPIDVLWFVPTHTHMLGKPLTAFAHRFEMTRRLTAPLQRRTRVRQALAGGPQDAQHPARLRAVSARRRDLDDRTGRGLTEQDDHINRVPNHDRP
ncbi:MAG: adenylyltransferase/cytidyltransferase family protein [Tessaracoccus sp.]|uniref:nicotinate-nicotinamide nucleotide adenylyltransferase n=1 Tax=Tessaracoccus sp. TaxID=1971211 RepID=UPI001ECF413D|nr:adenylyltransferase/cytidyltransferase family protein [Tessaracoccus sp.]MBK7823109.1 adenylyltransferase/cytidyltransferase family protein [Tessaracoccus sp.]